MTKVSIVKGNVTVVNNKGGNEMLLEKEINRHCLHCNAVLSKKGKYCNRACYNSARKAGAKTPVAPTKTEAPVKESPVNNTIAFEKALNNMKKFESPLTLHRLKKLIAIAGDRAIVVRVDSGVAIHWVVGDKCYIVFYRPGSVITCKRCEFEAMKASINRLMKRTMFKDTMRLTKYIELAEQMKGGE